VQQSKRLSGLKNMKPFVIVDDKENLRHYFNNTEEDLEIIGGLFKNMFFSEGIKKSCRTRKPYKGVNFRYADEYLSKEIINEIKLKDNAEELFFNYFNKSNKFLRKGDEL
jgi:hypothetical protein